jgi:hypothetical protein
VLQGTELKRNPAGCGAAASFLEHCHDVVGDLSTPGIDYLSSP